MDCIGGVLFCGGAGFELFVLLDTGAVVLVGYVVFVLLLGRAVSFLVSFLGGSGTGSY